MKRTQHVNKSKGKSKTKMKVYNSREAQKVIRKNGWTLARINADHYTYKHPDHSKLLTITVRGLNRIVWERLVNEFNLDLNI